ncbi:MAG: phosphatidate cytidylyltransferase [Rhodospirillales bacterium]
MPAELAGAAAAMAAQRGAERAQLVRRTLSALVLAPAALLFIHLGSVWFQALVAGLAAVMGWEWARLVRRAPAGASRLAWSAFGAVYIALPCLAVLWLREGAASGRETLMWLALTVWATDMAAFACGKAVGGPLLAPWISPAKTWAGSIGGLGAAVAVSAALAALFELETAFHGALLGLGVGLVAEAGDLLESALKRHFGVKDTGSLIPGHGGALDRLDAMMTAAPFVAALAWLNAGRLP